MVHCPCTAGGHSPVRASLLLPQGKDECLGMGPGLDPHRECRLNSVRLQRRSASTVIEYSALHLFTHACIKVPVKSAFVSVFTHVSSSTCSGAACSGGHITSQQWMGTKIGRAALNRMQSPSNVVTRQKSAEDGDP